jgi:transcriptional regulator with XRE-family HTH domain
MKGEEIKRARLSLGLSQEELAQLFGTTGNTVARWERDESTPAYPGILRLAFEALQVRKLSHEDDELKQLIAETSERIDKRYEEYRQRAPKIREELEKLEQALL